MNEPVNKTSIARQVELIIRQLSTLSTLPEAAAGLLPHVLKHPFSAAEIFDIVEADAALTASVLALAGRLGIAGSDSSRPLAAIIDALPEDMLRDALLSVKVVQTFDTSDIDSKRVLPHRQLALHALATACCAGDIAELVLEEPQRRQAFTAGLLHDIGKSAVDEAMPKSFEQLILEARRKKRSLVEAEQHHLGLSHALLGKRLAEKWQLPEAIVQAIWLHHCEPQILLRMQYGRLCMVVALADRIARQCGIGDSGSYDAPDDIDTLSGLLRLERNQLEKVINQLPEKVNEKSKPLGFEIKDRAGDYYQMIHQAAAHLAHDNSRLSQQTSRSVDTETFNAQLLDFLSGISNASAPDEIAGKFALCARNTIQAKAVCVLLWPEHLNEPSEIAIAENGQQVRWMVTPAPDASNFRDATFAGGFELIPAAEKFGWCLENIPSIFAARTLAAPLLLSGRPLAVVLIETENEIPLALLKILCGIGASAVAGAKACRNQREQTERLVDLMSQMRLAGKEIAESRSLGAIAEMAAGAAHELNNPLTVISGRVQLLAQTEQDENKKLILSQIQQRTQEISDIVTDLMTFARPREPYRHLVSPKIIIDEAIEKTVVKYKLSRHEIEQRAIGELSDIYADKSQIIAAVSYILSNALESYTSQNGPVIIEGSKLEDDNAIEIRITDAGCGMDNEVLSNATKPFFSAKPAGRKRGMGLAHAQRLLALNGATLALNSTPQKGTTVIIRLPRV